MFFILVNVILNLNIGIREGLVTINKSGNEIHNAYSTTEGKTIFKILD